MVLSSKIFFLFLKVGLGNSLSAQWLGLHAFTVQGQIQSLVQELRPHKLHGVGKKKVGLPPGFMEPESYIIQYNLGPLKKENTMTNKVSYRTLERTL